MSINYIKLFEDGSTEATLAKPSWGMYVKESADDNREVFIDDAWCSTTGGELVTNGTFDTDVSGWTLDASSDGSIAFVNGTIQCTRVTTVQIAGQTINTEIGVEYTIDVISASGTRTPQIRVYKDDTITDLLLTVDVNTSSATFVAQTTTTYIDLQVGGGAGTVYYDNISVYKTQPTLDTIQLPHTYLSQNGKLAGVEVANGIPVDIHYDELAPTLVEDTIKVSNLVVTDSFDLGQTWQDVKASRMAGVTYTNSTGKPIFVAIRISGTTDSTITIDGVPFSVLSNGYFVIPSNSTYKIASGTISYWVELR